MALDAKSKPRLLEEVAALVASLIPEIGDEYRADEESTEPSMQLTCGTNDDASGWGWQTGDNSFTGGAYGWPHWAVVYLDRESDPAWVANDIIDQWEELVP